MQPFSSPFIEIGSIIGTVLFAQYTYAYKVVFIYFVNVQKYERIYVTSIFNNARAYASFHYPAQAITIEELTSQPQFNNARAYASFHHSSPSNYD